ncbi:uncharacterized protein [Coffea arabica]|uniref:Retrovirus-related Pol polyprotein from transposon TNT 1-94-like beta-barrel domain-containing protein n=1 Tax=Coffea arabica TaxID=13443 RepID=A0ABM4W2R1_COFAR
MANDLWDMVETDHVPELSEDPTIAEMRAHRDAVKMRSKAMTCIHSAVSDAVFTKIMTCETAKKAWDALKVTFQGNDRTKQMQVLNLRREFELLKMKDTENIKEYSDRLLNIVNTIKLIGEQLPDSRVVEKVLVSLPERFEAKISSLEDLRDLSQMTLPELINALEAQEQKRVIRTEEVIEGAFQATNKDQIRQGRRNDQGKNSKDEKKNGRNPLCPHCKKTSHPSIYCWFRPDVQYRFCKQMGHMERVCKKKKKKKREHHAQMVDEQDEEQLFVATCFASNNSSTETWLIDSGCTHHMAYDESIFRKLDKLQIFKVRIGNGDYIKVKGKGSVAIDYGLVKMRGKNFALNFLEIDNSKVQYYEPKNSDDAKIQEEIIDESIEGG